MTVAESNRRRARPLHERFWPKVEIGPGCWEWRGPRRPNGYGTIGTRFGSDGAHRVAWSLSRSAPVPDGMIVRHTCDNPGCVNPAHLRIGTQRQNVADARDRDRIARGQRHGLAKLTEAEARAIMATDDCRNAELAERYGVSATTISLIRSGRKWAHLGPRTKHRRIGKLTPSQVAEIKASPMSHAACARAYGVDASHVSRIRSGVRKDRGCRATDPRVLA